MATVNGTVGDDFIHVLGDGLTPPVGYADLPAATDGNDTITPGGGDDIVVAGGGDDTLVLQDNFTALDQIDGGMGSDTLQLDGDYSAGVTFTSTTLTNVELVSLAAGHSYSFTTNDATVAAGVRVKFDGGSLGALNSLYVDASAETDGNLTLVGGAGNDTLIGGAGSDFLYAYQGGNDTVIGNGGDDVFVFFGTFTTADHIDGGPGNDTVYLHGNYSAGVTFGPTTMVGIETIDLDDFFDPHEDFRLTTNDATVAAGQTLTVTGGLLSGTVPGTDRLLFDGSVEKDGNFIVVAGAANDVLTGGAGNDTFTGGAGNDMLVGGAGIDTAIYSGARANYLVAFDTVTQTFTITDLRAGSPNGIDTAQGIEQLKFSDATYGYDTLGNVTSQSVTALDGTTAQTLYDPTDVKPWSTQVLLTDSQGRLTQQTINRDNGTSWINSFDPASAASWTWKTDHYDAANHQISQNGTSDEGTHWLTLYDAASQFAWSSITFTYDAQWNQTGIAETNDDNSTTVSKGAAAVALDTALWFTNPYDPNFTPLPPQPAVQPPDGFAVSVPVPSDAVHAVVADAASVSGPDASTSIPANVPAIADPDPSTQPTTTQQTFTADNGTRWVNTIGTASWETDHYDAANHLVSQNGTNADGTHWLTLFDTDNQSAWSSFAFTYDAQWNQTGLAETNDDGSNTVSPSQASEALDGALWFTNPYVYTGQGDGGETLLAVNSSGAAHAIETGEVLAPATPTDALI